MIEIRFSDRDYLCCITPPETINCQPYPNQFQLSTCSDILSHYVLSISIWFIGIVSTTFNIISIIWHSLKLNKKYAIVQTLIINLSIVDLLMGFYLIAIASANVYYSNRYAENLEKWLRSPICLAASFLISFSSLMSTFIMFMITLDRYLFLVYPFADKRLSYKHNMIIIFTMWLIAAIFVGLPIVYSIDQPSSYRIYSSNSACLPANDKNLYLLVWLLSYGGLTFLTWISIAIMYIVIIWTLTIARQQAERKISTEDKIIRAKMIVIVITDLICWLPLYIIVIRVLIGHSLDVHTLPFVAVLSLPLNSSINPILYTIFNKEFVGIIKRIRKNFYVCCNRALSIQYGQYQSSEGKAIAKDNFKEIGMFMAN